jgi:hypothetical protein
MFMSDPLGQALHDFHFKKKNLPVHNWINGEEEPLIYPSDFFREKDTMNDIELCALKECKGVVLDVGAGAGCHSYELQNQGFQVTSLELSSLSCEVLRDRGLKEVFCENIMHFQDRKYDTILLLMNGFGIARTENDVPNFLCHLKTLLQPGGCILGESTDIFYMMERRNGASELDLAKGYYGEVEFSLRYGNEEEKFPWIYLDEFLLEAIAGEVGLKFSILERGDRYNFLCKLEI